MSLITLARASEMIPNFNSSDNSILQDCVNASQDVIERYCNRAFELTMYDELYDGQGYNNLLLYQYPVTQILRVSFNPVYVLQVRMTDQGVSRASFRMDGDSSIPPLPNKFYLVSLKNGVETDITIDLQTGATTVNGVAGTTFTMLTLADLATAINSFSSYGWYALALGIYTTWSISDLRPPQGAFECRWFGNAYITHHSWNIPDYSYNPDIGEIASAMGFTRGYRNYRVIYQAGYSSIPYSIQQACAELAASVYNSRGQNPALNSESLGGYSYSNVAEKTFHQLDFVSRYSLELYRNRRAAKFKLC